MTTIELVDADRPVTCSKCGRRLEGITDQPVDNDDDGPIYAGACPVHGEVLYQIEETTVTDRDRLDLVCDGVILLDNVIDAWVESTRTLVVVPVTGPVFKLSLTAIIGEPGKDPEDDRCS